MFGKINIFSLWESESQWQPNNPSTFFNCKQLINYANIPQSWGGTYNLNSDLENPEFENFNFEIFIDNDNKMFTLPLHKTYDVYDYNTCEKIGKANANYNFDINWGDNSPNNTVSINEFDLYGNKSLKYEQFWNNDPNSIYYEYPKNFPTPENPTGMLEYKNIQHVYNKPGKYLITISKSKRINYNKVWSLETIKPILDTLYVHERDTFTWRQLIKIYSIR